LIAATKQAATERNPTTFVVTRPDDQSRTAVERRGRWTIGSRTKIHAAGLGTASPLRRDREFEAPSLQWRVEGKPAAVDGAPRRRRRKKAGLIEIELEGGRRVRVDRDVDAAALERVPYEENTEIFAPRAGRAHTRARDKPAIPRRKGDPRRRRRSRSSPPMR
jgi:hypothetical protein